MRSSAEDTLVLSCHSPELGSTSPDGTSSHPTPTPCPLGEASLGSPDVGSGQQDVLDSSIFLS